MNSPAKELLTRNRSLRERIRDSTSNIIPSFSTVSDAFTSSSKSRSVDQSLLSSSPPTKSGSSSPVHDHVVGDNDTLTSIAARYDCTPSELIKINRLNTRLVFPGQHIKVPNKNLQPQTDNVFDDELQHTIRKFIKINARHITDGNGVVNGTLLVTPNAVMFDPNVSDPLVLDQGAETYGVILPLEVIVHCGIYSDIAHMKVYGKYFVPPGPKPLLYPNKITKKEKVLKRLSFPLTWMESLTTDSSDNEQTHKSAPPTASHNKKRDSKSFEQSEPIEQLLRNVDKLIERQDEPVKEEEMTWYLCLTSGRPKEWKQSKSGLIVSYGQKNHLRPEYWFHIVHSKQVEELYKFWMIWWPHLYSDHVDPELISARGYELIDWETMDLESVDSKNKSLSSVTGEVNEFTKESWEMLKSPYTKLSSLLNRSQTLLTSTSSSATNFGQGILDSISDFTSLDYNNEEVVSMSDELRQALYGSGNEEPELIGNSEIINVNDTINIAKYLTPRAQGYPWTLMFTTSLDGFSLSSLYRKMSGIVDVETPVLLLIQDTLMNVFGGLLSTSLRPSDNFYGTGQSFLFNIKPDFKIYKWTGDNMFFIKGNTDGILIGAGDGKFGLWLDGDLNCGRTDDCSTYGNPPLVQEKDFVIKTLECWAFLSTASTAAAATDENNTEELIN